MSLMTVHKRRESYTKMNTRIYVLPCDMAAIITAVQAAKLVGTSRNHIRLMCHHGYIKSVAVNGQRMYGAASVVKFMNERPDRAAYAPEPMPSRRRR